MPRSSSKDSVTRARNRREQILEILYEAEVKGISPSAIALTRSYAIDAFIEKRIRGIEDQGSELADLISHFAIGWEFDRISPIDRCVLLLGAFEIISLPSVPGPVCVNEAVSLANKFSSGESVSFINGVLGAILAEKRPLPKL